ncbi:helix-turn-helix domain-containing protein [Streptomyces bambusae]|uniref:Helix-turn-helix domain-containing protein n=1 Tax=Streptomyces bambusae TaxID=1550616 RepID=A0ABS6ZA32_9ACTN|nr:helix-turn-helix domain-containing protein [Streptomyces bambusae]MBW5484269.1 helix-turn-helix domain-containing protein [Streptomyces bambusae]
MASQPLEFEEFAACLRALKERSGLSYGALARKSGISSSSLHRYCSGSYVPQDYGSAHRFATACGASPEELRRLHRLWALADASREPGRDAATDQERAPELIRDPDPGPDPVPDPGPEPEPEPEPGPAAAPVPTAGPAPRPPGRRRKAQTLAVIALALALGATAWVVTVSGTKSASGSDTAGGEERLLFSKACTQPVSMGQHDACVREAQRLLARAGAGIDVDGDFGPQTLRRVTAFQVLSGISPNGVVGDETKKALYSPGIRMASWSPEKVRQRVREVFHEAPDRAVAIADCQSFLDPFHILPNTNGSRNWGVFQISDGRLRELGGTPRDALDPEWNIQAAHRLWSRGKNFGDWPHCDRAYASPSPSPSGSPSA